MLFVTFYAKECKSNRRRSCRKRRRLNSSLSFSWDLVDLFCSSLWIQWLRYIVANRLDNTEAFGPTFTEQELVAWRQIFRSLNKSECNCGPITCPNIGPVNIDDSASLRYRTHVKHCLILSLDGRCVAQNKNYLLSVDDN